MDHLEFIKLLLAKGADVNVRVCGTQSTPTNVRGRQHRDAHQLHHAVAV